MQDCLTKHQMSNASLQHAQSCCCDDDKIYIEFEIHDKGSIKER